LDGSTLLLPGDGVHSIRYQWVFDPPLTLPRAGEYAFFLAENPCIGTLDVLSTEGRDLYTDGVIWLTGRSATCRLGTPGSYALPFPDADLIFQIEFCDTTTPTRHTTWGQLKRIYR
jgi:hypothetical protein